MENVFIFIHKSEHNYIYNKLRYILNADLRNYIRENHFSYRFDFKVYEQNLKIKET
jgi:hypothetical protein